MATAKFQKQPNPVEIKNFLGLNEAVGNTEMEIGEFSSMQNFRITKDMKLQKRPGHYTFIDFTSGDVKGMWYGTLDGNEIMLVCHGGYLYEYDMTASTTETVLADLITEGTVTQIGAITDATTDIFYFQDKVYLINGTDYKEYDGTTYQDVDPYVPTIVVSTPPAGGGTLFEEINLLTGLKQQDFVGDGSTTTYQLAETGIDATAVTINIDDVAKTEGTHFTVNRTNGTIDFTGGSAPHGAPANLADVEIIWDKVTAGNADLVKNHKYATQFGVDNDTNIFIFGNTNEKHVFRFSMVAKANYFPVDAYVGVGSTEFAITDLVPQYQGMFVYKENASFVVSPTVNSNYSDNTGLNPYDFGYEGLNNSYGNLAPHMVQLIRDTPITLDGFSLRQWTSTRGVRNEVEPTIISDRIKLSLQELDLSTAITIDYEFQKELWINVGNEVYVWNYGNDTFYKYESITATKFLLVGQDIYYGSSGTVEYFSSTYTSDNDSAIDCQAQLGFTDFDALQLEKNMRDIWAAIEPANNTSVDIYFPTDRNNIENCKTINISYKLFDYGDIDYGNWSYETNRNPQPKRKKPNVKKFTYIAPLFKNNTTDETLTILKLELPIKSHRYSG